MSLNFGCISSGITGNPLGTSFNLETSLKVYLHILSSKLWKVITAIRPFIFNKSKASFKAMSKTFNSSLTAILNA